jgi:RecB family exonuclease
MPIKLSFSKISTYIDCNRKYFLSYIAKLGNGSSPYMSSGSILHKIAEDFVDWELNDKTREEMLKYYYKLVPEIDTENLLHESYEDNIMVNPLFEEKAKKSINTLYEDLMLNHYKQNRVDDIPNIVQQEQWFNLKLKDGHEIRGLIDRVDLEDYESDEFKQLDSGIYIPEHIIDYKSGQSRTTFKALLDPLDIKSMQLSIYALARYKTTGKIPYKSSFFYIEPAKGRKKQEGQYRSSPARTIEQLEKIETFLNDIANEIENNLTEQEKTGIEMFPMNENANCFFCDFNRQCPVLAENELTEIRNRITIGKVKPDMDFDPSFWD